MRELLLTCNQTVLLLGAMILACCHHSSSLVLHFELPIGPGTTALELRLISSLPEPKLLEIVTENMPPIEAEMGQIAKNQVTDTQLRLAERRIFRLLQPTARLQAVRLTVMQGELQLDADALETLRRLPGNLGYVDDH